MSWVTASWPSCPGACGDASNLAIWKAHLQTLKSELTDAMLECLLSRHLEQAQGELVMAQTAKEEAETALADQANADLED